MTSGVCCYWEMVFFPFPYGGCRIPLRFYIHWDSTEKIMWNGIFHHENVCPTFPCREAIKFGIPCELKSHEDISMKLDIPIVQLVASYWGKLWLVGDYHSQKLILKL